MTATTWPRQPSVLTRLWRQPLGRIGLAILVAIALFLLLGPLFYDVDPTRTNTDVILALPSTDHPLGTDRLGRDTFARLMRGGLVSIPAGIAAVGLGAIVGSVIGIASGFVGGWIDNVTMRVIDIMLTFPTLLTAIVMVAILGPSVGSAIIAISVAALPTFARVLRSAALPLRTAAYVDAARVSNTGPLRMLFLHVIPNTFHVLLVLMIIGMGNGIVVLSALSFLGIGVQPPEADWGVMLTEGVQVLTIAPITAIAPALALVVTVVGINFVGEGLAAALDVRSARLETLKRPK